MIKTFNTNLFNSHGYNYQKEQYVEANLVGYGSIVANVVARIGCSAVLAGYGGADFACLRRRFVNASLAASGGITARLRQYKASFAKAIAIESSYGETLTIPTNGVLNVAEGTIRGVVFLLRDPGTTDQYIFDGAGPSNRNLQVLIRTDGRPVLRYGTGTATVELIGSSVLVKEEAYWLGWRWSSAGVALFVNGIIVAFSSTTPDLSFGALAYVGSRADGTCQLDGLLDDLQISSRVRTDAEMAGDYPNVAPLSVDADTTYKLNFDDSLDYGYQFAWVSSVIDASQATDKTSGHAGLTASIPGSSSVIIQSRSAPSQTGPWSSWYNALPDGTLQHPANSFVQIKLLLQTSGEDEPILDKLTVSFDGTPSVTLLASDFTAGGQFYFAVLQDTIGIVNGLDAPRKYDGEVLSLMGGNPPHASQIAVHKNRWWLAKGSRLYFSDLLDIDSWPVLNFIDINPNDGDYITGIRSYGDYLVIAKQHSTWLLTGEGINTFAVRRIHAGKGAYAARSLIVVNEMVSFVMADGIYFSDLSQAVMMSERERQRWNNLNARRIDMAASWYSRHKLYVAVPDGSATRNNTVIVFDTLRQAFVGAFNWRASCWCGWREGGKIVTLYGSSEQGQVYEIESDYSDGGAAYTAKWRSKDFHFNFPEAYKRYNKVYLQVKPSNVEAQLNVYFYVDGVRYGPVAVIVPASADGLIHSLLVLASRAGVVGGRYIAIEIDQNVLNNPVGVQLVTVEYRPVSIRPTVYS